MAVGTNPVDLDPDAAPNAAPRSPAPPRPTLVPVLVSGGVAGLVAAATGLVLAGLWRSYSGDVATVLVTVVFGGVVGWVWAKVGQAWRQRGRSRSLWAAGELVAARVTAARSRTAAWASLGLVAFLVAALVVVLFVTAQHAAVAKTFLQWHLIHSSWWSILKALQVNIEIAAAAGLLSSLFGLTLALARLTRGASARPLRALAVCYIDLFRGLPSIVVIYLVCFGIPIAGLPVVSHFSPIWYAIIALTLTYGAYNAELFRSGIESIHESQRSAGLSLGLSPLDVTRYVILPQMLRRIAPALLSSFVALQKDTALVNVVGIVDTFTQAKIYATNYFNLSAITVVCVFFVVITIPQTRLVDALIARSDRRSLAGVR